MKTLIRSNTTQPLTAILNGSMQNDMKINRALQCKIHGDYQGYIFQVTSLGQYRESTCPRCKEERKHREDEQAQKKQLQLRQVKIKQLIGNCDLPERYKQRTFENFSILNSLTQKNLNIVRIYAEQFDNRLAQGSNLIFSGNPGTGKTHLAAALANHIMCKGRSALYITTLKAIRSVKECYRKQANKTEQQVIDAFKASDLLILDEVGVQFGTETEKQILFEILNGRYEEMLPTVVISNLTLDELTRFIGKRLLDRLQEGDSAFLSFDWESYRKQVHLNPSLPTRDIHPVNW